MCSPFRGRILLSTLAACLCFAAAAPGQQLQINEIMAAGQSIIADEEGAFFDWIELHNPGEAPVDLAGWHLTDAPAKPAKWTFPARSIPAGGHLVVFASGRNLTPADGPLHTSFSLKSGGEYLALVRPDGSIAHAFEYPVQLPDLSFEPAGERVFDEPTPGAANTSIPLAIVTAPEFSDPHGFRDAPFELALVTSTEGAVIRYTLDGTEPAEMNGAVYTKPLLVGRTSVIRAAAFATGAQPSPVVTRTYLFTADIVRQSLNGSAPKGWPKKWGSHRVDYGLDPRIVDRAPYKKTIRDDLRTIPSLSIVMDLEGLFDPATGIYANPQEKGREWERPMSLELIEPHGDGGFQVNAGLRIRGGASRDSTNPKHSFRVLFRKEYGAPELKYPLFGPEGAKRTARFDIRCEQLVAWHHFVDPQADFIRDIFGRDTQGALGQPYKRGDFCHLYINGQYWGLYQTDERVTAEYGTEYFGGNDSDYDVVKFDAESGYGTGFTDGTFGAWRRLFEAGQRGFVENADYFRVQGLNPDGSRNRNAERLLDVDNLIDYMLAGIYVAADDSPPAFGTQNNWYAMRSRKGDFGFRFFAHDWEISMRDAAEDRVGAQPESNPFDDEYQTPETVNGWHFWQALRLNPEFRLRVADRVQRYFFRDGQLTPEASMARWQQRMEEIDRAVVGESARWGDARRGGIHPWKNAAQIAADWLAGKESGIEAQDIIIDPRPGTKPRPQNPKGGKNPKPFTREDWFAAANDRVLNGYLVTRSEAMLQHLRDGGLFPALPAPEVTPFGGHLPPGELVTMSASEAPGGPELRLMARTIYYTTDGSDPRRIGGQVAESAQQYTAPFSLARQTTLKARTQAGEEWSPLIEVTFTPGVDYRALRVTEIHYNPSVTGQESRSEFLELKNTGAVPLDLSGARFTAGVTFTFPDGVVLEPSAFYVLVRDTDIFAARYPGVRFDALFEGALSNGGETLTLATATGARIFSVTYRDTLPWPVAADGAGFSLVRANDGDPDRATSWRASASAGGSPGADDPAPRLLPKVVVNEVLLQPAGGGDRSIELRNLSAVPADISGWWISPSASIPHFYRIPAGTVLPAGGFQVFTELQLSGNQPWLAPWGGGVWLFSAAGEELTGHAHGFYFVSAPEGVSLGRHVNSEGVESFPLMEEVTLGAVNSQPRFSPLRISELHYFPLPGDDEFVEIENLSDAPVGLGHGVLEGLGFNFPADASVPANGRALVVRADAEVFREKYGVPADVPIFGNAPGNLQDNGELVNLYLLIWVEGQNAINLAESVRYNDRRPWPTAAAGFGASLQRIAAQNYADEPLSWVAGRPSPGLPNITNAPPRVRLTSPADGATIIPPRTVSFAAEAHDADGTVAKVQFLADGVVIGEDDAAPFTLEWRPSPGLHDLSARAFDDRGDWSDSEVVTIDVDAPEFGSGLGLLGEYFTNTELAGDPVLRNDAQIRFDWAERPPMPGVPQAGYSVRWTGKLLPQTSGDHGFFLRASGGVRLFIKGELLLDQWDDPAGILEHPVFVQLTAGELTELQVEYAEGDGFGHIELRWATPGQWDSELIPQNQFYLPEQDRDALGIASPQELSPRPIGRYFRTQLQAINGSRPYRWSASGNVLPAGLSLSAAGVLSGTPTSAGVYALRVRVEDSLAASAAKIITLRVTDQANSRLLPKVRIATPAHNATFGGGPITFTGTADAPRGLAELRYSVNNGPWHSFAGGARWSIRLDAARGLAPGRNQVRFVAVDSDGRESASAQRNFTRNVQAPLQVSVEGAGSVTRSFLGTTSRLIGKDYVITATPAPGYVLQEWRGLFGNDLRMRFTMFEGLEITAVFVRNPYTELGSTYAGLIGGETPEHATRGAIEVTMTRYGAFTGALQYGGRKFRLRGKFGVDGSAFLTLRSDEQEYIGASLQLNFESGEMDVHVWHSSDAEYVESFGLATRADAAPGAPSRFAHLYTMTLSEQEIHTLAIVDPEQPQPQGHGYGSLRVAANGRARMVGVLSDGTRWKAAGWVRRDNSLAVYAGLNGGSGSLSGELEFGLRRAIPIRQLSFATAAGSREDAAGPRRSLTGDGELLWSTPAGGDEKAGAGRTLDARTSAYSPPDRGQPAISIENAKLLLIGGGLEEPVEKSAVLAADGRFSFTPAGVENVTLRLDLATGIASGSFVYPQLGLRSLRGIVDQSSNELLGHFQAGESGGALEIRSRDAPQQSRE